MKCIYCSYPKTKVTDKRISPNGVRRRRECLKCGKRFTTYEKPEKGEFYIIKKDKRRERFDIEKLKKGIDKAFEKRPVSQEDIDNMINQVEEQLIKKGRKEIKSSTIGEMIMKRIKKMDNVAYIRFASVYRDFKDVNDFKLVLKEV